MSVNRRRTASSDIAEVSGGIMNGLSKASEVVDDKNIPIVVSPWGRFPTIVWIRKDAFTGAVRCDAIIPKEPKNGQ